ncbi:thioredoxin fold domain-containing protein [Sediminibacter sp. Hel_I_10]|uniref:thioredoxin family protein n=1 Tax=Sediminibacter sp. Hel_I_10 TaxID=1392490 RepID=UPI00047E953F|nr:thioredoxin fold domain-containing protein [Sediminibacter sp. Hel_I_10]
MRTTLLFISVLLTMFATVTAQEIKWMTFEEALAAQKKNPKKIMMDVYTSWCGPCKMLDKNTFHNKDVVAYVNKHFYAVKFNAEGNDVITYKGQTFSNPNYKEEMKNRRNSAHELSRFFQVSAYPTIVYLDEKGEVIAPIKGYQKPQQIELYLKMFNSDAHKELTTQEAFNDYYKAFTPEFEM